jgi:hypothetical protein
MPSLWACCALHDDGDNDSLTSINGVYEQWLDTSTRATRNIAATSLGSQSRSLPDNHPPPSSHLPLYVNRKQLTATKESHTQSTVSSPTIATPESARS